MTNLDSILKSRDISLLTNIRIVKAMYRYESWTMKKAEHQRIHAFELWCWRRLLRVPCKDSYKDSKEIKPVNPIENQP